MHSEWPKLYGVLAILSAVGLKERICSSVCKNFPYSVDIFLEGPHPEGRPRKLFPFVKMMGKQGGVYIYRALDKREYLMIIRDDFSYFTRKPYVVTPHLNCLIEMVQRMGHNIRFCAELTKIIPILCCPHSTALFFGHIS